MTELTKSTEDYLEAIYNLLNQKKVSNVKAIAKYLNVSLPAVSMALKHLQDKDLVVYKAYAPVKLTNKGMDIAKEITERHIIIRTFLIQILKLNEFDADQEACAIEHAMSPETIKKLSILMDQIRKDSHFQGLFVNEGEAHLCDQKPGTKVKVIKILGEPEIKRRITEMGLTQGTEIEVLRKAPLGDPIEIKARGFLLSLRHNEAHNIIVEL